MNKQELKNEQQKLIEQKIERLEIDLAKVSAGANRLRARENEARLILSKLEHLMSSGAVAEAEARAREVTEAYATVIMKNNVFTEVLRCCNEDEALSIVPQLIDAQDNSDGWWFDRRNLTIGDWKEVLASDRLAS